MSDELSVFQRTLAHSPSIEADPDEEDWDIPLAFSAERHTEKIQGLENIAQTWRLKDRVNYFNFNLWFLCVSFFLLLKQLN